MSLHRARTHPQYVPDCWACRVSTIQFSTAPTDEARSAAYNYQHQFSAEFHNGDREAYKRLRRNGEQPPTIAGSADLEARAETSFEISTGAVTDNRKGLDAALAMCSDAGFDPMKAAVSPLAEMA